MLRLEIASPVVVPGDGNRDYWPLSNTIRRQSHAALIERMSQVAQSKALVFVRKPERFANGVDQVADFLPLRFIHRPDHLEEIRIEVSL